jgi:hypothetical protein
MKLKVVYNKYIPLKGFVALTLWPWIFVREEKSAKFTQMAKRHEGTHAHQQVECLLVGFLIIYCLEWAVKLPFCKFDSNRAYRSISFEQEAYDHQEEIYYNDVRRHFAWRRYLFTIK